MIYRLLADLVVIVHALFIVFSVLGALLVVRWTWVAWLHLPAVAWAVIVQVVEGGVCPLTPLENHFRQLGGLSGYGPSFIDHYLTSLIYVDDPPAWLHMSLGIGVLLINLAGYGWAVARVIRRRRARAATRLGHAATATVQPTIGAQPR